MEHRWNSRRPLTGKVILNSALLGLRRARIRDIGAGGVCIELQNEGLVANLHIELVFVGDEGGVLHIHRVPALVVWTSHNIAGLMFYEINPRTFRVALNAFPTGELGRGFRSRSTGAGGPDNTPDMRSKP